MSVFRIGDLFARMMTDELGYKRFAIRATDLGTGAAQQLGLVHSNSIIGLHLSGANPGPARLLRRTFLRLRKSSSPISRTSGREKVLTP